MKIQHEEPGHPLRSQFEEELRLPYTNACRRCDAKYRAPLLPWLIGQRFQSAHERILFVGKTHRGGGDIGDVLRSGLLDATETVMKKLRHSSYPFWSYTRSICENLYGSNSLDYAALTNLVKCSNTDGKDATTPCMLASCLKEQNVIWHEVRAIQPHTIVFYTYSLAPHLLDTVPIAIPGTLKELNDFSHKVRCGARSIGWWERTCATLWHPEVRLLVTAHPERKNRNDFVRLLTDWLRPPHIIEASSQ